MRIAAATSRIREGIQVIDHLNLRRSRLKAHDGAVRKIVKGFGNSPTARDITEQETIGGFQSSLPILGFFFQMRVPDER